LPLAETRANLTQMVRAAKTSGARVLLVGMRLPPNYGPEYTRDFSALFATLARQEKTALLPFLLEPIALDDAAFQADRLHPTAAAQPKILDHVWKSLQPIFHNKNV
ncbi:MAG: arylesterase, partial [Rhodocyclaceae bacterium]|nr:arylesterase [Rhodocyclaceae bacterium]